MFLGFKGNLVQNAAETTDISAYFVPHIFNLQAMMYDMFEQPARNDDGNGGAWAKEDWLCIECVRAFIKRHKIVWWLRIKHAAGKPIPEDCQWGYNCYTQTHDLKHARNWNHFCEQTET